MSRMRQTVTHHHTTTSSNQDHESNLDALLEDLQTTVSRSNSSLALNGGNTVTGYREVRRTVTDGSPHGGVSTEYQIEYLNPANSTYHVAETNTSYQNTPQIQKNLTSYNYTNSSEHRNTGGRTDVRLKQNISELDSLLDDLNTAQKRSFSDNTTVVARNAQGIDSRILEPVSSSTPHGGGRVLEEKRYREERVVRGRSSSPRRELVFTGSTRSRDPSPIQSLELGSGVSPPPGVRQQQFYRYEKTTSTRTTAPVVTETIPALESSYRSQQQQEIDHRPLSPLRSDPYGTQTTHQYTDRVDNRYNGTTRDHHEREYSPQRYTTGGKTNTSYNYSRTSRETSRNESPRSPQPPHRSPSPVSFQQPPLPLVKQGSFSSWDHRPQSPQSPQKFSPSDPTHHNLATYKYSTTTTTSYTGREGEDAPLLPRPFPTPSPPPDQQQQQPPKKLDELMATFSDTDIRDNRYTERHHRYESDNSQQKHLTPNGRDKEKERVAVQEKAVEKKDLSRKVDSKNAAGPPVYYPPGVELFKKKEEAMAMQSGGGQYKAKAKYEYEAKSKSKSKESSGKTVVPVCLPVCCAMPCTIM